MTSIPDLLASELTSELLARVARTEIELQMENYIKEYCQANFGDMHFPFGIQGHSRLSFN